MKADNLKKKKILGMTYICYNKFMKKSNDRDLFFLLYVTMKISNTLCYIIFGFYSIFRWET